MKNNLKEEENFYSQVFKSISENPNPTIKLGELEDKINQIIKETLPKEKEEYFINKAFYSIVNSLWERNDFEEKYCERINNFFKKCLNLIYHKIQEENPQILLVLNRIFARPFHGFFEDYKKSTWKCNLERNYYSFWNKETIENSQEINQKTKFHFVQDSIDKISGYFLENIEYFGQIGGFEKIISEILSEKKEPISIFRIFDLLKPIEKISNYYTKEFLSRLIPFLQKILDNLTQLISKPLKKTEKSNIFKTADLIFEIIRSYSLQLKIQFETSFKMNSTFNLINSKDLEYKLIALEEIEKLLSNLNQLKSKRFRNKYLSTIKETIIHWIKEKEIIQLIFNNVISHEIIRKTKILLEFIGQNGFLNEFFNLIWHYSNDNHKIIVEEIYILLSSLSQYLSLENYNTAFEPVLKSKEWNNLTLFLLQNFGDGALKKHSKEKSENKQIWIEELNKFWGLVVNSELANKKKIEILECFENVFSSEDCSVDIVVTFIIQCFENLKLQKGNAYRYHLIFYLFDKFPQIQSFDNTVSNSVYNLIFRLDEENDISNKVFEEFKKFKSKPIPKQKDSGNVNEDLNQKILVGDMEYIEEIIIRLEMLKFILDHYSNMVLLKEKIDNLWEMFFENALTIKEKEYFLDWTTNIFYNNDLCEFFFQKSELFSVEDISISEFNFFRHFSQQYNIQKHKIKGENSIRVKIQEQDEIYGINKLWSIVLNAKNEKVANSSINYLIEFQNLAKGIFTSYGEEYRRKFIAKCIKILNKCKNPFQEEKINRILILLSTFINSVESDIIPEYIPFTRHMFSTQAQAKPIVINIKNNETTKYKLRATGNDSVFSLRKSISKLIKQKFGDFTILSHPQISSGNNSLTLFEVDLFQNPNIILDIPIKQDSYKKFSSQLRMDTGFEDQESEKSSTDHISEFDIDEQFEIESEHSKIKKEYLPSYLLARYFDEIFQLLEYGDEIAQKVWFIILRMPTNEKIIQSLKQIFDSSQEKIEWKQIFNTSSIHTFIYQLQVVDRLRNPYTKRIEEEHEQQQNEQEISGIEFPELEFIEDQETRKTNYWSIQFIQNGGIKFLVETIPEIAKTKEADKMENLQAVSIMMRIIYELLIDKQNIVIENQEYIQNINIANFVNILMDLIEYYSHPSKENNLDANHIVFHSISIILAGCSRRNRNKWINAIKKTKNIKSWIKKIFIESKCENIRENVYFGLHQICKKDTKMIKQQMQRKTDKQPYPIREFFLDLLFSVFGDIYNDNSLQTKLTKHFFQFVIDLIQMSLNASFERNYDEFFNQIATFLQRIFASEKKEMINVSEETLLGYLDILKVMLMKKKYQVEIEEKYQMIDLIINNLLFNPPKPISKAQDKFLLEMCKSETIQRVGFDFLIKIVRNSPQNFKKLYSHLKNLHKNIRSNWNYDPVSNVKSSLGYLGLSNLGATCYLNSLLQQFYMMPEFRMNLLSIDLEEELNKKISENVLYQLQLIFAGLTERELRYVNTKKFVSLLKLPNGSALNPYIQMDALEFFNIFLDIVEQNLQGIGRDSLVHELFGGKIRKEISNIQTGEVIEKEENIYSISLKVLDQINLEESLDLFVKEDIIVDENELSEKETNAYQRIYFEKLPRNLVVHLKRFEVDNETKQKYKVNSNFEFPMNISLEKYTKEGIAKRELEELERNENIKENTDKESQKKKLEKMIAEAQNKEYGYHLCGIIVHFGSTVSGQYYSLIKEREALNSENSLRWLKFEDTLVTLFDENKIGEECFGGENIYNTDLDGIENIDFYEKENSAYMLFYERDDVSRGDLTKKQQQQLLFEKSKIYDIVWKENEAYFYQKKLINPNYYQFLSDFIHEQESLIFPKEFNNEITQFALAFIFQIGLNSQHFGQIKTWITFLKKSFNEDEENDKYLLKQLISNENNWFQMLIYSTTDNSFLQELIEIICSSLKKLLSHEKKEMEHAIKTNEENQMRFENTLNFDQVSQLWHKRKRESPDLIATKFIDKFTEFLPLFLQNAINIQEYLTILKKFLSLNNLIRKYVLSTNLLTKLIDFYLGADSPLKTETTEKRNFKPHSLPNQMGRLFDIIFLLMKNLGSYRNANMMDIYMIEKSNFIEISINSHSSPDVLGAILNIIYEKNEDGMKQILDKIIHSIDSSEYNVIGVYFKMFRKLFESKNENLAKMTDYAIPKLFEVIKSNFGYKKATLESIRNFRLMLFNNTKLQDWMLAHKEEWVYLWLIEHPKHLIREEAKKLIQTLLPIEESTNSEEVSPKILDLFGFLLGMLPSITKNTYTQIKPEEDQKQKTSKMLSYGFFHLTTYFELLNLQYEKTPKMDQHLKDNFENLWSLFLHIEKYKLQYDSNKDFLIKFMETFMMGNEANIVLIVSDQKKSYQFLRTSFVLKDDPICVKYNQSMLPSFFSILRYGCSVSEQFSNVVKLSSRFKWVMKNVVLETDVYWDASNIVVQMCDIFASDPNFRIEYLNLILENVIYFSKSPRNTVNLVKIIISQENDISGFIKSLKKESNIMNVLGKFIIETVSLISGNELFSEDLEYYAHLIRICSKIILRIINAANEDAKLMEHLNQVWKKKVNLIRSVFWLLFNVNIANWKVIRVGLRLMTKLYAMISKDFIWFISYVQKNFEDEGVPRFFDLEEFREFIEVVSKSAIEKKEDIRNVFDAIGMLIEILESTVYYRDEDLFLKFIAILKGVLINSNFLQSKEDHNKIEESLIRKSQDFLGLILNHLKIIQFDDVFIVSDFIFSILFVKMEQFRLQSFFNNAIKQLRVQIQLGVEAKDEATISSSLKVFEFSGMVSYLKIIGFKEVEDLFIFLNEEVSKEKNQELIEQVERIIKILSNQENQENQKKI
ncbi:ubiquitin carboxyl-terminal hydrolase 14 [Anaeramoeba ignava]|uniref:Ubiquitin carboxyl-terminal hydrolase 14 n=1 Tax=Anaeramoeba ignava TaxID=1746090 RepID=A0A9Q0RBK5_ANAIG|nr:ubiquitin carboxyl-terminal hydrolase 14 [Anaeramoeba ignava]